MLDLAEALDGYYDEVDYQTFYRDIFPEGSLEPKGVYADGLYCGIAVSVPKDGSHIRRYSVTDDLEILDELAAGDDFCLVSPISYCGKTREFKNARYMYAMAIDLDGVTTVERFQNFIRQFEYVPEGSFLNLPTPTYLVSSGTGIHIYYVFEEPIPLYKTAVQKLDTLKHRLTWQAWSQGASALFKGDDKNVQFEPLGQGFRMVGTVTKVGTRCRAFRVGDKVTIPYLDSFVPEKDRAGDVKVYQSTTTLEKAKELYPDWYQRRIVDNQPKQTWTCNRAVYDWWIRKVMEAGREGHRYWCIMTLATYAAKCRIPQEELEADAFRLMPILDQRGEKHFVTDDVMAALEANTDNYITYPIHAIVARTGIPITPNKRNYRKQSEHVRRITVLRDLDHPDGSWRNGNGRKPKKDIVQAWRKEHPDGRKADCERDTGLSRHTVLKWWDDNEKGTP